MRFEFMNKYKEQFSIEKMAEVLSVSSSGYYDFLKGDKSKRAKENERLKIKIIEIHKESRGVYGSPRVHAEMNKQGEKCSRRRVAKLMREEKIQAKMRKKWKKTTQQNERVKPSANHLDQNFITDAPNKVWVSDITYVATREGWLYVSIVMDLFSRKIVGLSMGERLHTELVISSLKQALRHRKLKEGLTHHSDRGCQYTSKEFKELTDQYGIRLSYNHDLILQPFSGH